MLVTAIHVAPGRRLPVRSLDAVVAEAGKGLEGDRYHGSRNRQVTIQSQELLDLAADELGYRFDAGATRRNLTVDAGEIPTRPGTRILIGEVELEVVRVVAPCRLLDDSVGRGAAEALRRRGGSACRVLTSGTIRLGDVVSLPETEKRAETSG
ncbi:MOSC domain-containing protein [Mycobacterium deserti]|uniref:MOSC domain-containing protein n=1 Tax=Mycobacterium deserti TaxID=2978347 RepID=A0ABT2ML42_9MYCO|nr:MOSC domain-containing protein [Mycobacterium deserti]MCT7661785.1 MOSC domain-containing protein [Mycobacterium deserti]